MRNMVAGIRESSQRAKHFEKNVHRAIIISDLPRDIRERLVQEQINKQKYFENALHLARWLRGKIARNPYYVSKPTHLSFLKTQEQRFNEHREILEITAILAERSAGFFYIAHPILHRKDNDDTFPYNDTEWECITEILEERCNKHTSLAWWKSAVEKLSQHDLQDIWVNAFMLCEIYEELSEKLLDNRFSVK